MGRFFGMSWHRWLVLAAVVAAVGLSASPLSATTGSPTAVTSTSATAVARGLAAKYVAALDKLDAYALDPILDKKVVEFDWAYGSDPSGFHGAKNVENIWLNVLGSTGKTRWRGSVCCAGPTWAAVTWRWSGSFNPLTNKPLTFSMKGLSILDIRGGKIIRETIYWDVWGRNPGVAPTIAKQYAAALGKLEPQTLTTLYSTDAVHVDKATNQHQGNAGNAIVSDWQKAFSDSATTHWQGTLSDAGPPMRLDNGALRRSWAVVDWRWSQATSPVTHNPVTTNGVTILEIYKGKITRETIYYDIPAG